MFGKNLSSKNVQLLLGIVFLVFAIVLISLNSSTITNPISIDYDKKTFSGTLPVIVLIGSGLFFWFGSKDKKDELDDAKTALHDAVNKISGRSVTLTFRFGSNDQQEKLKAAKKDDKLKGSYSLRSKAKILKEGAIVFYEDPQTKTVMAELSDMPFQDDHFLVFEIEAGATKFQGSESLSVRVANLNI